MAQQREGGLPVWRVSCTRSFLRSPEPTLHWPACSLTELTSSRTESLLKDRYLSYSGLDSEKKNIKKISDISCFYSPSSMLVKVTQVSTQHLLAQSSAAVQCNSPHNALLEKFPPAAAALHPLANIHPLQQMDNFPLLPSRSG